MSSLCSDHRQIALFRAGSPEKEMSIYNGGQKGSEVDVSDALKCFFCLYYISYII